MKKLLVLLSTFIGLLVLITPTFVQAATGDRQQTWDLSGQYIIDFQCTTGCNGKPHLVNITSDDLITGNFAGSGYFVPDPNFTWDVTGQLTGDSVNMHILYTGSGAGYFVDMIGTVAANGTLSGTAVDRTGDLFNWQTTSGAALRTDFQNHGQFVLSQSNKSAAAQSDLGKPIIP